MRNTVSLIPVEKNPRQFDLFSTPLGSSNMDAAFCDQLFGPGGFANGKSDRTVNLMKTSQQ
jgi:hypothetical protein